MKSVRQITAIGTEGFAITKSGTTPSRANAKNYAGNVPWVKSGELKDQDLWATEEAVSEDALNGASLQLLPPYTVLVAMYGATAGKTSLLRIPATINQAICSIRPIGNSFYPRFLQYFLIHERPVLLRKRYGGAQPNLNQAIIRNVEVPALRLPEQRKIAAILFRIQKAIELQEAIIERTRELKKAAMQFVFTHGLMGEKTKETEIGRMPESWDVVRVGDSLEKIRFDRDKQIPASEYKAFGKHRIIDQGQSFIAGYTNDDGKLISENLPLIVFGDHTRTLKLVDFPFVLGGDGTKLLKPISEFDGSFFFYGLNAIDIPSRGYNRHFPLLANSYIPKPDEGEQKEIAHIFSILSQKVEDLISKKSALQDLFKTTLNKLMSGEIRVKDLEIDVADNDKA